MQYIWFLIILFVVHYLADFFIQIYAWKSTSKWLRNILVHTITYVFVMVFGIIILQSVFPTLSIHYHDLLYFSLLNFTLHFITDVFTKKLGRVLKRHNEFNAYVNVIALDQMIHYITLLLTFGLFFIP